MLRISRVEWSVILCYGYNNTIIIQNEIEINILQFSHDQWQTSRDSKHIINS